MVEDDKVMVELEIPKDQVSVHPVNQTAELEKTKKELARVKKQRNELREKVKEESSDSSSDPKRPMSIKEAVAKELDPTEDGPIKDVTGYELGEIITAPLHPPEGKAKDKPVRGQVHNLFVGFALMPLALIALLIFGGPTAIAIALVGAAFIAMGVLVRV